MLLLLLGEDWYFADFGVGEEGAAVCCRGAGLEELGELQDLVLTLEVFYHRAKGQLRH